MPTTKLVKFPFRYKHIDFGRIPDPVISLPVLTKKEGWKDFEFLVDSGADATNLPVELAVYLDCEIDKRKKTEVGGIEGDGVVAYPGKVKIKIGQEEMSIRCFFIKSDVIPLLGRVDIWDKYTIVFDNMGKEVVFERL